MKSWNEIRKAATAFSKRWKNAYDEKAQAQSFLKEFFAVFGVDAVTVATFEHRVKFADGSQGYADCFWPGTILIEMKSRGIRLRDKIVRRLIISERSLDVPHCGIQLVDERRSNVKRVVFFSEHGRVPSTSSETLRACNGVHPPRKGRLRG